MILYWSAKVILNFPEILNLDIDSYYCTEKNIKFLKATFGKRSSSIFESEKNGNDTSIINKPNLLNLIKRNFPDFRKKAWQIEPNFLKNLNAIQKIFGLNELEKQFLAFVLTVRTSYLFNSFLGCLGDLDMSDCIEVFSVIFDSEKQEISKLLSYESTLFKTGLIKICRHDSSEIGEKFGTIEGLADQFFLFHKNPEDMFKSYIKKSAPATLSPEDFSYLEEFHLITTYLKAVLERQERGANILFYGPPGTGKTELARLVARESRAILYEVGFCTKEGKPFGEDERFSAYRLAQFLLERRDRVVLLFDEVDDILNSSSRPMSFFYADRRGDALSKAWLNHLIEENVVPTIWICNRINHIDQAYLRRFDVVVHLDYLPRTARLRVLKKHLDNLPVSDDWLRKAAELPHLSPAVIAKAAKVLRYVKKKVLESLITSYLKVMGVSEIFILRKETGLPFLPEALHIKPEAKLLFEAVSRIGKGRFLFYGPPGTGKTELARQIAKHLDRELVLKRASDLISPYVGETEINIARMFKEARKDKVVLFLDEADSFLQARKEAHYFWEVTMVNELLTQMETFEGLFICATNFIDRLDEGVMRRFDLKVKFDYLRPDQSWKLFVALLGNKAKEKHHEKLSRLRLTPGNFATVYRKLKLFSDSLKPEDFLEALKEEALFNPKSFKKGGIGFISDTRA
ncbi:AAA family ATPase [Thermodesulfatator autotrophicus]|uniref:AAA+ ATPase domain-containing protein n=1 Tax=Thermodesulfatator autotrophicus TaxID=1795632 RepID=A0A177E5K9_9BACT|nr:ATP-binding protein [Thermodesulfatator autotrophicus]OAG26730.1 hypothetical protein TH606_10795 [Thermodesulfatator autotrophicus]